MCSEKQKVPGREGVHFPTAPILILRSSSAALNFEVNDLIIISILYVVSRLTVKLTIDFVQWKARVPGGALMEMVLRAHTADLSCTKYFPVGRALINLQAFKGRGRGRGLN